MLKKIAIEELRIGMYIQSFEGSWIEHPFWKNKFVVRDDETIRQVIESGVPACWIDVSKGVDVARAQAVAEPPAGAAPPPAAEGVEPLSGGERRTEPVTRRPETFPDHVPMADEIHRAAALCKRSRQAVLSMFKEARLGHAVDTKECQALVNDISDSVFRNAGALVNLARLKTADEYSYMHSVAVCALMVALARQMGMSPEQCREAGLAGLLHDLGKALVPGDVLNKPGKLTPEEFKIIQRHPELGHQMLLKANAVGEVALDVCRHHHERIDGKGYPDGLSGDSLSLMARMGAVCDVYDAITSNRPYKAGWDPAESLAKMASWDGQFDTTVFQIFVKSLGIYPTGSLVRLTSGRLAVVVDQHPEALTAPLVKAFFSLKSQMHVPPELVDLSHPHCRDRIEARESPSKWNFKHLNELWAGEETLQAMSQ